MPLPTAPQLAKAALVALLLALLGYVATPDAGWLGAPRLDAALLMGLGALVGGALAAAFAGATHPSEAPSEAPSAVTTGTLFVGNLAFKATEEELGALFASHGKVRSTRIMRDRKTRRPRGYGFVEMADAAEAHKAIRALDGKEFHGRRLRVKEGNRRDEGENGGE